MSMTSRYASALCPRVHQAEALRIASLAVSHGSTWEMHFPSPKKTIHLKLWYIICITFLSFTVYIISHFKPFVNRFLKSFLSLQFVHNFGRVGARVEIFVNKKFTNCSQFVHKISARGAHSDKETNCKQFVNFLWTNCERTLKALRARPYVHNFETKNLQFVHNSFKRRATTAAAPGK